MAFRKEGDGDPITVEIDLGSGVADASLALLSNTTGFVRRRATAEVILSEVAAETRDPNFVDIPLDDPSLLTAGVYDIEVYGTWTDTPTPTPMRFPTRGYYELTVEPALDG
jgi:hypothetical protein